MTVWRLHIPCNRFACRCEEPRTPAEFITAPNGQLALLRRAYTSRLAENQQAVRRRAPHINGLRGHCPDCACRRGVDPAPEQRTVATSVAGLNRAIYRKRRLSHHRGHDSSTSRTTWQPVREPRAEGVRSHHQMVRSIQRASLQTPGCSRANQPHSSAAQYWRRKVVVPPF